MEPIERIRRDLPILMWQSAGISRQHSTLEAAISKVNQWQEQLRALAISEPILQLVPGQSVKFKQTTAQVQLRACSETLNLLDIGYLMLKSALFRTESRGGHYREDFPQPSQQWEHHTLICGERWCKGEIH